MLATTTESRRCRRDDCHQKPDRKLRCLMATLGLFQRCLRLACARNASKVISKNVCQAAPPSKAACLPATNLVSTYLCDPLEFGGQFQVCKAIHIAQAMYQVCKCHIARKHIYRASTVPSLAFSRPSQQEHVDSVRSYSPQQEHLRIINMPGLGKSS